MHARTSARPYGLSTLSTSQASSVHGADDPVEVHRAGSFRWHLHITAADSSLRVSHGVREVMSFGDSTSLTRFLLSPLFQGI